MNYRHAFHAGNFADVMKHATLALIIEHLKLKSAPFRVIDTHAGIGRYDLDCVEAQKTGEWREGIGRLVNEPLPGEIAAILEPYLRVIISENPGMSGHQSVPEGALRGYPGSPLIASHLIRPGDALVANELHPADHELLEETLAGDRQAKVLNIDGWHALKSLLPPKERRGVVLVDPPFEEPGELSRMVGALEDAVRRFATGTFVLWYPIKDQRAVFAFRRELVERGLAKLLSAELLVRAADGQGLAGSGLAILNPPFSLEPKLQVLLPFLANRLAQGPGASCEVRWLAGERTAIARS